MLQPFATIILFVGTVLTVYGIETLKLLNILLVVLVGTVLTVYGIETLRIS